MYIVHMSIKDYVQNMIKCSISTKAPDDMDCGWYNQWNSRKKLSIIELHEVTWPLQLYCICIESDISLSL